MWGQLTQKHRQLSNQVQHKMLRIMELVCRCCCRLVTGAGGEVINNRPPTAPLGRSPSVRAAPHRFRPLHARQLPKPARADLAHLSLCAVRTAARAARAAGPRVGGAPLGPRRLWRWPCRGRGAEAEPACGGAAAGILHSSHSSTVHALQKPLCAARQPPTAALP